MMIFKSSAWTTSTNKNSGWIIVVRNAKSVAHNWNDGDTTTDVIDTVVSAKYAISVLAKKSKSWKRLAPIIDLALYDDHATKNDSKHSLASDKRTILSLLENDEIPSLFNQLNMLNITDQYTFTRFKKEYQAGLKGIDLIDWKDRMKVFLNGLNKN